MQGMANRVWSLNRTPHAAPGRLTQSAFHFVRQDEAMYVPDGLDPDLVDNAARRQAQKLRVRNKGQHSWRG